MLSSKGAVAEQMGYLTQIHGGEQDLYKHMGRQVHAAAAVIAGRTALNPELFGAIHRCNADASTEVDGSTTALKEVMAAFSAGFFGQFYGRVSTMQQFRPNETVTHSIDRWNRSISNAYAKAARLAVFREMFFGGGLWHVFIDRYAPDGGRDRFASSTDTKTLAGDRDLLAIMKQVHPFFLRTPPAHPSSHSGSQHDAGMFGNTILDIGEKELGIKDEGGKEELLANSLPELRWPARLEMTGINLATGSGLVEIGTLSDGLVWDRRRQQIRRAFLTIDDKLPRIGFDMEAIEERVQAELPDVASYPHRGCAALYQTTEFGDHQASIFSAMAATLVRMYRETGAFSVPLLR